MATQTNAVCLNQQENLDDDRLPLMVDGKHMKKSQWLRLFFSTTGILTVFSVLVFGNLSTPILQIKNGGKVNLDSIGNRLVLLEGGWKTLNDGNNTVLQTTLYFSGNAQKYGLYLPRANNASLYINGQNQNEMGNDSHIFSALDAPLPNKPTKIELRFPTYIDGENTVAKVYIGSYATILDTIQRESNLRLLIVGISFAVLHNSISLFLQKRSEKYLLHLAVINYSTLGYIILNTFPSFQAIPWINFLLLGTIKLPIFPYIVSQNIHKIFFALLVAILNYLLLRNFVSVKIGKISYIIPIIVVAFLLLFTSSFINFFVLNQAFFIFNNLLECIVIIKGSYQNEVDRIILTIGCIGTVAFRGFMTACGVNLIPHGDIDLLYRLGGVTVSFYSVAFSIMINGVFARKFSEAEVLAGELEKMNKNLQKTIDERVYELRQAYDRLEKEQQQKDTFVTNMVHNIKTPLFSLGGYADMARASLHTAPEKTDHFLDLINTNVDYVGNMVNNLFLALRLEYGRVHFMLENVNVCSVLEQVYNTTLALADTKGITVLFDRPDHPILIECDMYYLAQAIQNIAENAVRHTAQHGCITFSIQGSFDTVEVQITDNGEGISEDVFPHIFERYYSHLDGSASSSGLGLSIAQDIIASHHGKISVSSKVGVGTEFTISLPRIKQ